MHSDNLPSSQLTAEERERRLSAALRIRQADSQTGWEDMSPSEREHLLRRLEDFPEGGDTTGCLM
jgi:hypothetical protein